MSFRDDYAAALRDEQQAKDSVNEARRAHKAAKERLAQLRKYAKEFEVKLDATSPPGPKMTAIRRRTVTAIRLRTVTAISLRAPRAPRAVSRSGI